LNLQWCSLPVHLLFLLFVAPSPSSTP
jgi:hypothetical protein